MKRSLLLIIVLSLSISTYAQKEHMKFMGIPLNGTITQFQQKLVTKGFSLYREMNKITPAGTRVFKGTFTGRKSTVAVYYNERTNVVYGAKAFFDNLDKNNADEEFDRMKNLLHEKYIFASYSDEEKDGLKKTYIYNIQGDLGEISVYQRKASDEFSINYPFIYSVHIEYTDYKNYNKNRNSQLDDL